MGDIIGGIIGGIGSLVSANQVKQASKGAANDALLGYNYLNNSPLISQLTAAGTGASQNETGLASDINELLTSPQQNNPAFQNYLNSTGYNFQMQQGQDAITGNGAARGILNSGATAKALTAYGQGLAGSAFQNYLSDLGGLSSIYNTQANQGLGAAQLVGQAGTTGGANAGQFAMQGAGAQANGIAGAFGSASNVLSNYLSNVTAPNPFG